LAICEIARIEIGGRLEADFVAIEERGANELGIVGKPELS
jgi:hypothetical protein